MENTQLQEVQSAIGSREAEEDGLLDNRNRDGQGPPPHGQLSAATRVISGKNSAIQVHRRTQLILRCEEEQQSLATALNSCRLHGINVLAQYALHDSQGTTWLLVVDDDQEGGGILVPHCAESVLLVEVAPRAGAAARLSRSLAAAKIDVVYSYAASTANDQLTAVFKTSDDDFTMRVLEAASDDTWDQAIRTTDLPPHGHSSVGEMASTKSECQPLIQPFNRSARRPKAAA